MSDFENKMYTTTEVPCRDFSEKILKQVKSLKTEIDENKNIAEYLIERNAKFSKTNFNLTDAEIEVGIV